MADIFTTLALFGSIVIIMIVFAFAVFGFIQWIGKKKFEIAYVDKYKQLVQVTKMNCPNELYEKKLVKVADKNFSGIPLGYIYGKNFLAIGKKWYHLFVISPKKRRIYNPFSWGVMDYLAIAEKEKISIGDGFNIKWEVGGLDYESFFIFASEGNLSPESIYRHTEKMVGLKQANLTLKRTSELVERAVEANPEVKAAQKVATEVTSRER